ncbi:pilus assembly protein PilZ [Methylobacterium dankookense]|uniref:PilZ domain-containing protein n=1 Tax=Methylobacterium dankookense TaxID=560405 RepID=A0A564G5Q1_9HYPH|nr:pilus assembly protein PilZ [Methylobacterium dankookense]GJD59725.1 hypothetical protein IFDJLNFL_5656 [Methylobacterium dankookense]VUF15873.1 hypothetical protein MTDSW087_05621 [Methylobacterium dankookense]
MPPERRRQPRKNDFKTGSLFFHAAPQQVDCLVWNLSDFGALIEIPDEVEIPSHFRLIATSMNIDRSSMSIWRANRKIGVAYIF